MFLFAWESYEINQQKEEWNKIANSYTKEELALAKLDLIIEEIEYFKVLNGVYPNNLRELRQFNSKTAMYLDPLANEKECLNEFYYYKYSSGKSYVFRSVGADNTLFTSDDVTPKIAIKYLDKLGLKTQKDSSIKYPEVICYETYKS